MIEVSIAGLCLLAAACHGESPSATWLFEVIGGPATPSSPSVVVRVSAVFPPTDHAFAGARFGVRAEDGVWSSPTVLDFGPLSLQSGRPGTPSGNNVAGILVLQFNYLGGFLANRENPVAVWEGTWTASRFSRRDVVLGSLTDQFVAYRDSNDPFGESRMNVFAEGQGVIQVVPAPAAFLALAGTLAAARRRR